MSENQKLISIIIPAYNAEHSIARLCKELFKTFEKFQVEIIIVNDCSPDKTHEECLKLIKSYPNNLTYMKLSKNVPDDYVDLLITSPPYADTLSYGKKIRLLHPDNYAEWFLPLAKEAARFLKPSGSFILNINDKIINGKRSIYVFELICRIEKETGLSLHDRYVWTQKSGLPTGGPRRLDD